jgi:hypothetical protein
LGAALIPRLLSSQRGTTLLETAVASAILLIMLVGLLSMAGVAAALTENHGHLAARTAEYAQDKMEQLLSLKFADEQSDTTAFPTETSGGTGLAVGGSVDPDVPVEDYTDYLDRNGTLLCPCGGEPPANWFYKRMWQVSSVSDTLKQIAVTSIVSRAAANAFAPRSTLVALKTDPF